MSKLKTWKVQRVKRSEIRDFIETNNFKYVGKTPKGKVIVYNGKSYHDKTIRTKYKGELKPFARKIKETLASGEAHYVVTPGKYTYLYQL